MKRYIAFLICLLALLCLAGCATAVSGSDGKPEGALDIDYITPAGYVEENTQAEESGSWLDWLRDKLTSDKAQRTATVREAEEAARDDGTSAADTVAGMYNQEPVSEPEEEESSSDAGQPAVQSNNTQREEESQSSEPVEESSKPEDQTSEPDKPEDTNKNTVTMHIRCDTAVANGMHKESKWAGIVPASGVILPTTTFEIKDGDTAFDVLCQARDKYKIHMQYNGVANSSSTYVQGINNLYEFDGGRWSGWMYSVNGWYPNYGCGVYFLKPGDKIEWNYTCDLGKDLGQYWMADDDWIEANS